MLSVVVVPELSPDKVKVTPLNPAPSQTTCPEIEYVSAGIASKFTSVASEIRMRTYSEEVHGKDFKKMAEGFAKKIDGHIE